LSIRHLAILDRKRVTKYSTPSVTLIDKEYLQSVGSCFHRSAK